MILARNFAPPLFIQEKYSQVSLKLATNLSPLILKLFGFDTLQSIGKSEVFFFCWKWPFFSLQYTLYMFPTKDFKALLCCCFPEKKEIHFSSFPFNLEVVHLPVGYYTTYCYLLRFVMVYMLGDLPFRRKILIDVKVTTRKTTVATDRPMSKEKSSSSISWAGKKGKLLG